MVAEVATAFDATVADKFVASTPQTRLIQREVVKVDVMNIDESDESDEPELDSNHASMFDQLDSVGGAETIEFIV